MVYYSQSHITIFQSHIVNSCSNSSESPRESFWCVFVHSQLYLLWMKVNVWERHEKHLISLCSPVFSLPLFPFLIPFSVFMLYCQRLSCIFMRLLQNPLQIFNLILFSKEKITNEKYSIWKTEPITAQIRVLEKRMLTFSTRCVPTIDIIEICICIRHKCIVHTHKDSLKGVATVNNHVWFAH